YLCDSILTPSEYGGLDTWTSGEHVKTKELKTSAANFKIPLEIAQDREKIAKYAELLESCVRNSYRPDEFLERCKNEGLSITAKDLHIGLYEELTKLDKANKNGVWARIIKNAFAPLFIEKVDYIVGNPPWVNWGSLPTDYRNSMKPLWQEYDLFRYGGMKARLGSSRDDISVLMTYVAHDAYLKQGGHLGFVITQTVFKTKGGGEGFRSFTYQKNHKNVYLYVLSVHDMSNLQPFKDATNRTAVFVCEKTTKAFSYPIPYTRWQKVERGVIEQDITLEEVKKRTRQSVFYAIPVDNNNLASPWLTAPKKALVGIQKVIGKSDYVAHAGVYTGGLNGCYWIRILKRLPNGDLFIDNLHDVGKKKVDYIQETIESDLVYPLIRGRDLQRWKAEPSAYLILANRTDKLAGIPEAEMRRTYPKTYAYLKRFEKQLRQRASSSVRQLMEKGAFYSMFAVGPYTLAPWKVMWRYIASEMTSSVVGPNSNGKIYIPDHRLIFIPLNEPKEAYYVSGLLNSAPIRELVDCFVIGTQIAPHILERIAIPKFDSNDNLHLHIANLSERCHDAKARGNEEIVSMLEQEIDRAAAKLWGITDDELGAIQDALKEIERPKLRKKNIIINKKKHVEKQSENRDTISSLLLQDKVSSEELMHLSHKAKYNNLLTPRERKALFDIPRLKSKGYRLSQKQIDYLEEIIRKAIDQGILDAPCNHHECEICNRIKEALKNSKD
ncbi:MAG: hypothetical protein DRP50_05350, partial [Thermotoga sp.]